MNRLLLLTVALLAAATADAQLIRLSIDGRVVREDSLARLPVERTAPATESTGKEMPEPAIARKADASTARSGAGVGAMLDSVQFEQEEVERASIVSRQVERRTTNTTIVDSTQFVKAKIDASTVDRGEVDYHSEVSPAADPNGEAERAKAQYEQTTLLKAGDRAADFEAPLFRGGRVRLSSLRGKVVLLSFWATWCGPCLVELSPSGIPATILQRFVTHPDFVFLPVAYTDTAESLRAFFDTETGRTTHAYLRLCTAVDPAEEVFRRFATDGVPRTLVIDRDGRIVHHTLGCSPTLLAETAAALAAALEDRKEMVSQE